MKEYVDSATAKGYVKMMQVKDSYKNAIANKKGSQALEYTFVIGAAVALAGVLSAVVKDSEIKTKMKDFVLELF